MLEEVLNYIHNYFERSVTRGRFVISSNSLDVDFLQDGQYFKIEGSIFNDGIYQYPCHNLKDEQFYGKVYGLAIPYELLLLVEVIEDWQDKYQDKLNSPFTSESFGGYSYTKQTGGSKSNGEETNLSWKTVFGSKLNHWRKIG